MASRTFGLGPRGFSFDASLTISLSANPYSRASSSMGFPGTYGEMRRMYSGERSASASQLIGNLLQSSFQNRRGRIGAQHLQERSATAQFRQRRRDGRVLRSEERRVGKECGA